MAPTSFLVRDILQHVVPTLTGLALFVPMVEDDVGPGLLVVAAVVLGYVLGPVVAALAGPLVRLVPGVGAPVRRHHNAHLWWSANVDFDRLWYRLSRDDRQSLHAARAYAELYAAMALYLAVYAGVTAGRFAVDIAGADGLADLGAGADALGRAGTALMAPGTAILGGWTAPSLALSLLAVIAFVFAARGYVREIGQIYGEDGHHVSLARTHHLRNGDIATGVWGRITRGGIPVREAGVAVFDMHDRKLAEAETDRQGRFQAPNLFRVSFPDGQEVQGRTFRLDINIDGDHRLCDVPIGRRQLPELEINLS